MSKSKRTSKRAGSGEPRNEFGVNSERKKCAVERPAHNEGGSGNDRDSALRRSAATPAQNDRELLVAAGTIASTNRLIPTLKGQAVRLPDDL